MSAKLTYKEMERFLGVPEEKRDQSWAHDVCTSSRMIHIAVWRFCPDRDFVKSKVIPQLEKAKIELEKLGQNKNLSEDDKIKIAKYVENDSLRINNLMNYLEGRPSSFIPDRKLNGRETAAG